MASLLRIPPGNGKWCKTHSFVTIERSNHSYCFSCRSFVWLGYYSHDSKWCTDIKQVLLCTHHLVRNTGKAVPPATRLSTDTTCQLFLIILFVPETYHPVLLRRKAIRLRKETGNQEWIAPIEKLDRSIAKTVLWSCIRPFQLLFFEPMVSSPKSREKSLVGLLCCSSASTYASYLQSYLESCTFVSAALQILMQASLMPGSLWCISVDLPYQSWFQRLASWPCISGLVRGHAHRYLYRSDLEGNLR